MNTKQKGLHCNGNQCFHNAVAQISKNKSYCCFTTLFSQMFESYSWCGLLQDQVEWISMTQDTDYFLAAGAAPNTTEQQSDTTAEDHSALSRALPPALNTENKYFDELELIVLHSGKSSHLLAYLKWWLCLDWWTNSHDTLSRPRN